LICVNIHKCLILILFLLIILNLTSVLYFNIFTHSLPYGIYVKVTGVPRRGEFAASCLTRDIAQYGIDRRYLEEGSCETGSVRVLKKIEGLPGDHFVIKNGFMQINGDSYRIMNKDSSGRPLRLFYSQKEGILEKDKYVLLSDFVKNSWDSRYWGPVNIQFLLKPLFIFDNVQK